MDGDLQPLGLVDVELSAADGPREAPVAAGEVRRDFLSPEVACPARAEQGAEQDCDAALGGSALGEKQGNRSLAFHGRV